LSAARFNPGGGQMLRKGSLLVVVNAPPAGGLGERGRQVAQASGNATVVYRQRGRLRTIATVSRAIARHRPHVIYGIDNSVVTVAAALMGRIACRSRFIVDTGDAVGALRAKMASGGRFGTPLGFLLERVGYSLASAVVARSTGLAERVSVMAAKPVTVIPDGYDEARLPATDGTTARVRWGFTPEHLVVGVLGSANWNHNLNWCYGRDVIEVVARSRNSNVRGAIIVAGSGESKLREMARQLKVTNRIVFERPADGYGVYEQIRAFDVGLSTQTNDEVGQCRTTGKLVQYIAAGTFVLASCVGEAARLLPEEMLVPYNGAWDDGYFGRLAERIDALPCPIVLRQKGRELSAKLRHVFQYGLLRRQFANILETIR